MHRRRRALLAALGLLLTGCGGAGEETAESLRTPYQTMTGYTAEAAVTETEGDAVWTAEVRCTASPEETAVEVLEPEEIAGVRAILRDGAVRLEYEDLCLNAGTRSAEALSPMECVPELLAALRDGWLLEENAETWEDVPCRRLTLDRTGPNGGKILSTVWLRQEDGLPLRGEISVDGERIFAAEFTSFTFCDILSENETENTAAASGGENG